MFILQDNVITLEMKRLITCTSTSYQTKLFFITKWCDFHEENIAHKILPPHITLSMITQQHKTWTFYLLNI